MRKFIQSMAGDAVTAAFTTSIHTALAPISPFKINLTDEEKLGLRSMAEGREGYARLVSGIATEYPDSLSRADVPSELSDLLNYHARLEANRITLLKASETISEIQLGSAADIMTLVDRFTANLQISRANEGSLDLAMREVDEYNKRFANRREETPTPPTP